MAIRLSGMTSGLDTDSIVKAMVSSYTTRKEKYQKAQTKLEWTQDAWKSLNTKVYSLYSNISNLRFSTAYNLKKTSVPDTQTYRQPTKDGLIPHSERLPHQPKRTVPDESPHPYS